MDKQEVVFHENDFLLINGEELAFFTQISANKYKLTSISRCFNGGEFEMNRVVDAKWEREDFPISKDKLVKYFFTNQTIKKLEPSQVFTKELLKTI